MFRCLHPDTMISCSSWAKKKSQLFGGYRFVEQMLWGYVADLCFCVYIEFGCHVKIAFVCMRAWEYLPRPTVSTLHLHVCTYTPFYLPAKRREKQPPYEQYLIVISSDRSYDISSHTEFFNRLHCSFNFFLVALHFDLEKNGRIKWNIKRSRVGRTL